MDIMKPAVAAVLVALLAIPAFAQLPPPPAEAAMAEWAFPWADDVPGVMSAADLNEKPAGKHGPIVARDGKFFAGPNRIKFVGVNVCFAACFPPKDKADAIARRLSAYGVNIVRFHHMDMQVFPNGIFADKGMEKLSPEALDRMDYFIAALKKEGVYTNLNLHVSRTWSKVKGWPNADKLESYDKQVDIFHPDLIAANKQYARDLLTHVNAYTTTRYADEPAVAAVEINNEDTVFLWGGEQNLAGLPEPYAAMLQKQWNAWLVEKYGTREKLAAAWAEGAEPLAKELIESPKDAPKKWAAEQHGAAKMTVVPQADLHGICTYINVSAVDGTTWHLQYSRPGISLKKGKFYTLMIDAIGSRSEMVSTFPLGVSVSMAHEPWSNLGLQRSVTLVESGGKPIRLGFVATADDANARLSFQMGASTGAFAIGTVSLREGGREGLREDEDPAAGTVARGGMGVADSPPRSRDWYDFLQQTDEAYFVGMRDWLKTELGVKAPITGTIGLGMLGTKSQRTMDFVDAHAYWDHPRFPRRQWDMKDWEIKNKPMVDDIAGATFWPLAATRVFGKPFTVTEYNHAAPNDWQAECVPMIFAYAAIQDWDAVYLFDYVADANFDKQKMSNFFSVEGNLSKLAALPLARRIFDGTVGVAPTILQPKDQQILETTSPYFYNQWPFLRDVMKAVPPLEYGMAIAFEGSPLPLPAAPLPPDRRIAWKANGPGTGQFVLKDANAAVVVGFAKPDATIYAGVMRISDVQTPFVAIQLVSATPGGSIKAADRLLLSAVARISNVGTQWDEKRTTVSDRWGKAPARFEVVRAAIELDLSDDRQVWAVGPDGKRLQQVPTRRIGGKLSFVIGENPTVWYEIVKN